MPNRARQVGAAGEVHNRYVDDWRSMTPASSTLLNGGEPAVASSFLLEIDGVEIGIFREVSGLEFKIEQVPYKELGQNGFEHQFPGRMTWTNIVFRGGLTQSDALAQWASKSSGVGFAGNNNKLARSTGAITAVSHTGLRLRGWEITGAWPVRWTGPKFSIEHGGAHTPLEEELEIAHQGFTSKTYAGS